MNIFVAFFVLLLLLAESTPPAASSIPLIGGYYCLNMIMITLSTFLSVIVINLYFRGDKKGKVPRWLKRLFIDFLGSLLCMRKELIPDGYDRKPIYTTEAPKDGARHRKRIGKHNKFQMQDIKGAAAAPRANHVAEATSPDKSPVHTHQSVEGDVREIRKYLRELLHRIQQKEERARINLEWKIVALVLDRVFFFMYLSAIIVSLSTIFPKTY
ncbi:hypothetical protein LSH36_6g07049 [Paralvinella palmiformis]|uniref:Neurotransmitter-gated ion-channel transmembrane domain-containing protein n=1 Tax=Paralvinella palmiformis TaxID=53620 RepID=A0AAD9NIL5_9ANNE|nr:hypothetical protein LSH36_6g07049 [Paralvinella palmiformis]